MNYSNNFNFNDINLIKREVNKKSNKSNTSYTGFSQKSVNILFKFQFDKKENIDKKILRKFRSFISDEYKLNHFSHKDIGKYLLVLIKNNSLPPFKFDDDGKIVEFKSFNNNFLNWMFSKKEVIKFFDLFIEKELDHLMSYFCESYDILNHENKNNEQYRTLFKYVSQYSQIYSNFSYSKSAIDNDSITTTSNIIMKNDDFNYNQDKNHFINKSEFSNNQFNSDQYDNTDNTNFIEKINSKNIFNHSIYMEENGNHMSQEKRGMIIEDKPFVSMFEDSQYGNHLENEKESNDNNILSDPHKESDENIINNNPANNDYNITYIDDISYKRLTNDFVTSVRNVENDNSFDAGYLLNRSLERSRDYDVWVYPDELYPFTTNEEDNIIHLDEDVNETDDIRMEKSKDEADNE